MISEQPRCHHLAPAPDGLTGLLLALEGIADAAVILHGPTGCRGYHGAASERFFPRETTREPLNYTERFYFGQSRIPTTYLDGDDFVFGGQAKLNEAVQAVLARRPGVLAVVNSPGAALIGDDLRQAFGQADPSIPCIAVEFPAMSRPLADGHQLGVCAVLDALHLKPAPVQEKTVILVGLSIGHRHWAGSVAELRALLQLCGITVCCVPGAGSAIAEWRRLPSAACHVVVHDEYGEGVAAWLCDHLEAPVLAAGVPVGFDATATWVRAVADAVQADPSPALARISECRRHAAQILAHVTQMCGSLKGAEFALQADPSLALPLAQWLYTYLGMIPRAVETPAYTETASALRLRTWLNAIGCGDAWQADLRTCTPDILFAPGEQVTLAQVAGYTGPAIEIMLSSGTYTDVFPKAMLGAQGSLWLIEQIVNGLFGS